MARRTADFRAWLGSIPRFELSVVAAAMVASILIVLAYILAIRPNPLGGDQLEYHNMAILFSDGKPFWGSSPFGVLHESAVRPPGYPLFSGLVYEIFGASPTKLAIIQSVLAPVTVALSWILARRLFGPLAAMITAGIVAVHPVIWEWFGLVYSESLAIPLTMLVFLVFLDRKPTMRLALGVGALTGLCLLVRPTSMFLFAGIAVSFLLLAGWRRGALLTVVSVAAAVLVVSPWTIRNYFVADGFVPLSVQDTAIHGTFNEESANDPEYPYAWRPQTEELAEIVDGPVLSDAEYRSEVIDLGVDYISEHPFSLVEAFYWNGITRYWDIRSPSKVIDEAPFEGRSKLTTGIGLGIHWILLPLAVYGLWRHRQRRSLVLPIVVMAAAASLVFTVASGTRYRSPVEPLIAVLAASAFVRPRDEAAPDAEVSPAAPAAPA